MTEKPFYIENELVIPKARMEQFAASKKDRFIPRSFCLTSESKTIDIEQKYGSFINYDCSISIDDDENLKVNAFVLMPSGQDDQFGGNIIFCVPSAKRSVKYSEILFGLNCTDLRYHRGPKSGQVVLCSLADALDDKNGYFENGKLKIQMKGIIFQKKYQQSLSPLGTVLWACENRDFVIVVGKEGDQKKAELKVHKLILSARSPVFARMLQTNMAEKKEGKVLIIDFGLEVVQTAVEFFYDQDDLDSKNIEILTNLLQFADKYDISDLKAKLEHVLKFRIFPDSLPQILDASIISNSNNLANICRESIVIYRDHNIK